MGKYALIMVSSFLLTFAWVRGNLQRSSEGFVNDFLAEYEEATAKITANSTAAMSLNRISDDVHWRDGYSDVLVGDGIGGATVADRWTDASLPVNRVCVRSWGTSGAATDSAVVLAVVPSVPTGVHASVTANAIVTELGNLVVDGRDHDIHGNLISNEGTLGVSTTQTLDQSGASRVGGTAYGADYAPSRPADPAVVEEFATYTFPTTPDEVFGYAEGTLKLRAQSGAYGGQYVTDPAALTFPLSGVTYVELPDGDVWQAIEFGASSGVLVVHNNWGNARIKDLNGGSIKGLLIADDVEKIHCLIIGAVVAMAPTPVGNCIGNGTGDVLFSREAIEVASSISAGGDGGVTVVSWWE
jgi:hypothetical protein